MKYLRLFNKELTSRKDAWVVIFFVLIFILFRMPSLVEPYWYGDEGIYQVIGKALNSGRILYQGIWDNKPPILYYIYALFNGDQFFVRALSLVVGSFSVIAFYYLGKILFSNKKSIILSTAIYVLLFATPLIEGNIANAENFMHLPIILSAILVFKFLDNKKLRYIFFSGVLLSIALMTKIVAVFEFTAFLIFLLASLHLIDFKKAKEFLNFKKIKPFALFLLGFLTLFILFILYFASLNALPDFLRGVLSENIDYVGVENNFLFPMGVLLIKIIIAASLIFLILIKRENLSRSALFIYIWLVLALFSTFFSQRPYMHYVLMTALPFSYFMGSIIEEKKHRVIKILAAIFLVLIVYLNFGIYKKLFSYYDNYIKFILYEKRVDDYQLFFDSNTPRDYELARFIDMFSRERDYDVFLWSDSGQIYALSDTLPPGKYIVAYHITYYNNAINYIISEIEKAKPTYIIQTKKEFEIKRFLPSYVLKYRIRDANIYERQN